MGINGSVVRDPAGTDLLKRLSSTEAINPMDPFWNQLLSFFTTTPISRCCFSPESTIVHHLCLLLDAGVLAGRDAVVYLGMIRCQFMKCCMLSAYA